MFFVCGFAQSKKSALGQSNPSQHKNVLVGTWKLVSATNTDDKGRTQDAFGANPTGFLTYTADGRMMAIITYGGRKPLSVSDHVAAPPEERAQAFVSMIAYAGRYSYDGDKVTHHVEAASVENWVHTDLVRTAKLQGNRLVLRTPPMLIDGATGIFELAWKRLSPQE
jgi:hypothetical protein